jgi:hypothetical protein
MGLVFVVVTDPIMGIIVPRLGSISQAFLAKCGSVDGGNHRFGAILDAAEARMHGARAIDRSCARGNGFEEADIRARLR